MTWGYQCDRINKLQKKAIRIVSLSKYNAHTEPIFKRLQLLKVADILKIQELKCYYRFMHNTLPRYLQRIAFHQNSTIHDYNARRKTKLHITRTNHEYAKRCIRHNNTSYHQQHHCTDNKYDRYPLSNWFCDIRKNALYTIVHRTL